jgi:hypothetical protein
VVNVKEELTVSCELPEMPAIQLADVMVNYKTIITENNGVASNGVIQQANEITEPVVDAHIEYIILQGDFENGLG